MNSQGFKANPGLEFANTFGVVVIPSRAYLLRFFDILPVFEKIE